MFVLTRVDRAAALLKLGRAEGYYLLKTIRIDPPDYSISIHALQSLYDYERKHGNWQAALEYYQQLTAQRDSIALRRQRGQVFVAEQQYQVAKKESHIARLERDQVVQHNRMQRYIAIGAAWLLAIAVVALVVYIRVQHGRARMARHRARMVDQLKDLQDAIQHKDRERMVAIAAERHGISRDMHDELSSSIAAIRYLVGDHQRAVSDQASIAALEEIEGEMLSLYGNLRRFMNRLNEADDGAQSDVGEFVTELSRQFGAQSSMQILVETDVAALREQLNAAQHRELTLVIREAVANAMKHSEASRLRIRIVADPAAGEVEFAIADNGQGFSEESRQGMGLHSMQERLARIGGTLKVSHTDEGTRIEGKFPANS